VDIDDALSKRADYIRGEVYFRTGSISAIPPHPRDLRPARRLLFQMIRVPAVSDLLPSEIVAADVSSQFLSLVQNLEEGRLLKDELLTLTSGFIPMRFAPIHLVVMLFFRVHVVVSKKDADQDSEASVNLHDLLTQLAKMTSGDKSVAGLSVRVKTATNFFTSKKTKPLFRITSVGTAKHAYLPYSKLFKFLLCDYLMTDFKVAKTIGGLCTETWGLGSLDDGAPVYACGLHPRLILEMTTPQERNGVYLNDVVERSILAGNWCAQVLNGNSLCLSRVTRKSSMSCALHLKG
jgi:hypothetical protein